MKLSFSAANALPATSGLRFDHAFSGLDIERSLNPLKMLARPMRHRLGLRGPAHALLADSHGVWAWAPGDCYAAATRHASVREWMRGQAGCDLRLWVSGDLMHSLDDACTLPSGDETTLRSHARQQFVARHGDAAAEWPLATWQNTASLGVFALSGVDLDVLRKQASQFDVRIRSVTPWWHHAFLEARQCVPALARAKFASVVVVEGRHAVWIQTTLGVMSRVSRDVLAEPSVAALNALIATRRIADAATVVLGQGLVDGGNSAAVDAHVLGRLDSDQPPQWLRPSTQFQVH